MSTIEQETAVDTITGAEILVEMLIRCNAEFVFAYPGGASMPLHQALRAARERIRTILPRHEQGGSFAAQGVARTTGRAGVCMATSGPGATNLVTGIADAKLDSVPMIAITGQVPQKFIGTDAFQETPMVEVCRAITKHTFMITDVRDVARIVKEAFYIATTGRPGPVLIDFPKDCQIAKLPRDDVDFDPDFALPGYRPEVRKAAPEQISQVVAAVKRSKRPVLYVGGGCILSESTEELREFALRTGIPVTTTVMGLGAFPADHEQSLHMLGMHGTAYANYAVDQSDLLLAFGVRFDDRVTGKLEEFAKHGKIVHVDIDPSEIHKNKEAHIPINADLKEALVALNATMTDDDVPEISEWRAQCAAWKEKHPLTYREDGDNILQQWAIEELHRQTGAKDPYITVGVGQHQMWAAQFYKFNKPRRWLSSSGLGTMGFGLPAAMGVQAAFPDSLVVNIDGDGSFQMNIQELATLHCEKLPVKTLLLNNQHLGMVTQWEDRFMDGRRAHTYLGPVDKPEALGDGDGTQPVTKPSRTSFKSRKLTGSRLDRFAARREFPAALEEMLSYDGPYLLDVICVYQEHVLPMIPSGHTVNDMILE